MAIYGHNKNRNFFKQAVTSGQLGHAYIFSGPEGTGKKLFAIETARGLLCEKGNLYEECSCNSCMQIRQGIHPDLHLFENKSDPKDPNQLNIKSIRRVTEISEMTAYAGSWKVIVLDDAHILSQGAGEGANALLKTLEEPGAKTIFFLVTYKYERVLNTIKSRCMHIPFEPLTDEELGEVLVENFPEKDFSDIIAYSGGSVSTALSLFESNIAELISALNIKDKSAVGMNLFAVNSKDMLHSILGVLLAYFTVQYRINDDPQIMSLIQFLKSFISRLDYNINLNIQLLDLYAKLSGVLK